MSGNKISVTKNFIYNSVFQVLILLVPFITTPYVSRILGAENIGKYSFANAVVTYFTLIAALGSNTYGQRKIAYYRDDKKNLSKVFWNTVFFRVVMSSIALILYIFYIYFVVGINVINIIIGLSIINVALDISWFFQGIEDFKNIVIRNLIVRIVCLLGIFILVKQESDVWIYVLILMISQITGSLSMWRLVPKHIYKPTKIMPFNEFKEIILIFLPTISIQVYTILDKSMIGWLTESDYANGCYEQSERIARLALTVVTSIGTVILPRVANLYHNDSLSKAKEYVYMAFRIVWMLAIPIMFGLSGVSSVFIPLFLGEGFVDSIILLQVFSILVLVVSIAYVVGLSYLIPTKQENVYTFAVTCAAIVNVVCNLFFIPKTGALGAAFASVIAETVGALIQLIYCIAKRQLQFKRIFASFWKYAISGILMFSVLNIIKQYFSAGFISLCILVVSGIIVYFVFLLIIKDDFTKKCFYKIWHSISSRFN